MNSPLVRLSSRFLNNCSRNSAFTIKCAQDVIPSRTLVNYRSTSVENVLPTICYGCNSLKYYLSSDRNRTNGTAQPSPYPILSAGFLWSLFNKDKDETPEDKLILTIKRSILCIQRGQYPKAEQMLHLALRMAQDLNHRNGITYVYDVMANLAMEMEQYAKAEKLFVTVMQRLMQDGYPEDDVKMLHMSSKVAHIASMDGKLEKAEIGFKWTLGKIEAKIRSDESDVDVQELFGLTNDFYGRLLMAKGTYKEAKQCFIRAFDVYTEIYGLNNEEAVMLLNNLGVVCTNLNDLVAAESYLTKAHELAKNFPDMAEVAVILANQGLLYIKKGLFDQAKSICSTAWKCASQFKYKDGIAQSNYCLKELQQAI